MRMYFYLGGSILPKDYNQIILAMRIMATGYGYDREKFEDVRRLIWKRKGFYRERRPCLIAFDSKSNQFKLLYDPAYAQELLGQRRAFLWYSDNGGEWYSISPEDSEGFVISGRHTYIDF